MRCKKCGSEMKIKSIEVGKDEQGNPIFNEYAFCYECKIKVNLDKRKTKKAGTETKKEVSSMDAALERLPGRKTDPQDDMFLTKEFSAYVEEKKAVPTDVVPEKKKPEAKKQPVEKKEKVEKVEKPERTVERSIKDKPERRPERPARERVEKRPERSVKERSEKRPVRDSKRLQEKKLNEMPEKRIKDTRKKDRPKKKKGFLKYIILILIIAALGVAGYFYRDTVKSWIHIGLEKFDSMTGKKDEKEEKEKKSQDIIEEIDSTLSQSQEQNPGTDVTVPSDNGEGTDTTGATDTTDTTGTTGTTDTTGNVADTPDSTVEQ